MKEKGQTVVILLLVVVVALGIGLTVVGRSINEISTSTKTDESSRAFSAAEAGIEKALSSSTGVGIGTGGSFNLGDTYLSNKSQAAVQWNPSYPLTNTALEYPAFGKESFAQFWLADPNNSTGGHPARAYPQTNYRYFNLYFGKADTIPSYYDDGVHASDKPAVEVTIIYRYGSPAKYGDKRHFIDSHNGTAAGRDSNGFTGCSSLNPLSISTNDYPTNSRYFYCRAQIDMGADLQALSGSVNITATNYPILARVRILYSNISHPVAIKPLPESSSNSLPTQANIYTSMGQAGSTQRTIRVFQEKSVMPNFFDYAIFSAGELSKQ